jgi:chorismate dehydratase
LRVGCLPYLNAKPLIHDFAAVWPEASLYLAVPRDLAHMLDEGQLDIALVSTVHQLHHGYRGVQNIGLVSDGPVRSVLLHSRVPLEEVEKVALLQDSLTSCALTKVILEEFYGRRPQYRAYHLPVEQGLFLGEAALTIGDPAYFVRPPARYLFDLGEEWRKATGLPFVYARWLVAEHVDLEVATSLFAEMKRRGCAEIDPIVADSPQTADLGAEFVRDYLTKCIRYDVGPRELEGLEAFFNLVERVSRRASRESSRAEPFP